MVERYRLSFTTGGLFLLEAPVVAEHYLTTQDWEQTRSHVRSGNLLQVRTAAASTRISKELIARLEQLDFEELEVLIDSNLRDRAYLLWVAACRRYAFVRDFAREVLRENFLVLRRQLSAADYEAFVSAKALWHDELDELAPSTQRKLRQNLFRMLREAELVSEQLLIQPTVLTPQLALLLARRGVDEFLVFPASDLNAKVQLDPRFASIVPRLTNLIDGQYLLEKGRFVFEAGRYVEKDAATRSKAQHAQMYQDSTEWRFVPSSKQHLSSGMTAEGFRKIGVLQRLLSNGSLNPGTTGPLLWDEPESNLNPKLMKDLVHVLLELSRNGQQIILATHDYVLLKWFDLLMDKGKGDQIAFHRLYRNSVNGDIKRESQSDYAIVARSAISSAFAELYDEDVKRALGSD